jgi:formylglycine-generating enzyme required for sulfatase activity
MKSKIWRVLIPFLLLSLTACEPDSETSRSPYNDSSRAIKVSNYTGKKIALVIGNWLYRFKPLNNPKNDAREMAQLLEKLGFEVIHKENLGFEEMEDEVINFKLKLKKTGQVGLFYFAGHGLEVQKENYLLPTDLRKPETELLKSKSIRAQWVVNVMQHAGSQVNIIILDACRKFQRPDIPRATSEDYGLAAMSAKGTIIGFATGSGQTASDGKKGKNGLYTGYLLKFMGQPGLTIEEVFKKTRQQVAFATRNKPVQQVPWVSNSLVGDFCLVSCPEPKSAQEQREKEALQRQKNLTAQLEQERQEKENLQRQLEALKNQPGPVQEKVFRDRLADGSFGPEMVWIAAGSFQMGDIQGGGDSDEKPVHRVSVGQVAMGKYEVTVGEFKRFVNATGYKTDAEKDGSCYSWAQSWELAEGANWRDPKISQSDDHPVVCVSWNDSVAYAEWLSTQTGQTYRLPTEAEWEYATRAGTSTKYWWGNEIGSNKANCDNDYCGDSFKYTSPVGSFAANSFDLYDTVGNVWEWTCSESEDKYNGKEKQCFGKKRARNASLSVRGGSWNSSATWMRSAYRNWWTAMSHNDNLGFRVARY